MEGVREMGQPHVSTTREIALQVACPDCGAAAGVPCLMEKTPPSHRGRHAAAVESGLPRYMQQGSKFELVTADGEPVSPSPSA